MPETSSTEVINLVRDVSLTLDDGKVVNLPAGKSAQVREIAQHWYVKANLMPEPPAALGDFDYAQAKQRRAMEFFAAYEEAQAEADVAVQAWKDKNPPTEPAPTDIPEAAAPAPTTRARVRATAAKA